jgi:rhamnopyranosyl-N-acetylglucosaminyl-diphospho-decaprenol beta-1,3/1,4-galactofuranosyltransferase
LHKGIQFDNCKVTAVVVTYNRDGLLAQCLEQVKLQSYQLDSIIVVDNANSESTAKLVAGFNYIYVSGSPSFGGAGGYRLGMLKALDLESDFVWLLDDDGYPSSKCLEIQIESSLKNSLDVSTPLCIDILDDSQTSNPYIIKYKKVTSVSQISSSLVRFGAIQLFNGALLSRYSIEKIGYPNLDLFIRGDELDYFYRIKNAGISNGLVTSAHYFHPSSITEYPNSRTSLLGVIIPRDDKKRYYQYRNQGYLVRRHHLFLKAVIDWLRYTVYFLIYPGADIAGFRMWAKLWWRGFKLRLEPYPPVTDSGLK